jgi:hypothetical protein
MLLNTLVLAIRHGLLNQTLYDLVHIKDPVPLGYDAAKVGNQFPTFGECSGFDTVSYPIIRNPQLHRCKNLKIRKCNDIICLREYFSFLPLFPSIDSIASTLNKEIFQRLKKDCGQRGYVCVCVCNYKTTRKLYSYIFLTILKGCT